MVDAWSIYTNSTKLLIPNVQNAESFAFDLLFMTIAGFLALTMSYVITKQDKNWMNLDVFSKVGVSAIVGTMSYLVVHLSIFLFRVLRFALFQKEMGKISLTYFELATTTIYAYFVLMRANRLRRKWIKNIDNFRILELFLVSFSLAISFYFLATSTLLAFFIIFLWSKFAIVDKLLLIVFILFLSYLAYSFVHNAVNFFTGKGLPYTFEKIVNKLISKIKRKLK